MNKTVKWLEVICRYFICLFMLIYGIVKVFQGQFYTDHYWKDTPLVQLSGMELAWSFYSYAPAYETIIGLIEVSIGLLVFFKRTTKLGIVLFLPVMANLVLVNLFFGIGALGSALPLFIAGVILLIINFTSYRSYFLDKGELSTKKNNTLKNIAPKAITIIIGCLLSSLIVYNNKFKLKQDKGIKGAWIVNGISEIKRVYFEKGNTCVIKDAKDSLYFGSYQTNLDKTITVSDFHNSLLNWKKSPYSIHNDTLFIGVANSRLLLLKIKQN